MKAGLNLLIEETRKQLKDFDLNYSEVVTKFAPATLIIMGDHTHYNEGVILSTAVDRYTALSVSKGEDSKNIIVFRGKKHNLSDMESDAYLNNSNWIISQIAVIHKNLCEVIDRKLFFNCSVASDIPKSLGLGSTASVSLAFLFSLKDLFALRLDESQILEIAHKSEKEIYGEIANRANLITALRSSKNNLLLIDLRTTTHKAVPFSTKKYSIIIFDTGIFIEHQAEICNERIEECDVGVKGLRLYIWGIKNLRDVQIDFLERHVNMLPQRIYNRCLYNVMERNRVEKCVKYLQKGRIKQFGEQIFLSHAGLSKEYEISSPELDFLVDYSHKVDGVVGSKIISCSSIRSTLNITKQSLVDKIANRIEMEYFKQYNKKINFQIMNFSDGFYLLND